MDQTEQDVLCPDVIVVEHASFLLRQYNDAAGSIGKALKHGAGSLHIGIWTIAEPIPEGGLPASGNFQLYQLGKRTPDLGHLCPKWP
jgi:hypothetical protein